VTVRLADRGTRLVLLDIEGTTTPITFVHDVLFPFARRNLTGWCRTFAGSDAYRDVVQRLAAEHAIDRSQDGSVPPWIEETPETEQVSLAAYVSWLMDRDRKSPGLKLLQGLIWEEGYKAGRLHGTVYPDVPAAMRRWRTAGIDVAIYSSGSELAQRRLFASTEHGDLTPLIVGFFDTAVGAKHDPESYRRIIAAVNRSASAVLFISDATAELDAAAKVGCDVMLSLRSGNPPQRGAERFPRIASLDEIV